MRTIKLVTIILTLCFLASITKTSNALTPHSNKSGKTNFYLKDGDRVVFYGDSITDQRLYTTYIESFCISRFPKKHFTFIHSGWGGDRVTGGGGGPVDVRLKRDVLVYKPTVVTICLGMNDGSYRAFDQNIFDTYLNGYRHILDTLRKELPNARITLLTAPAFDDVTRAPSFPGGYNATLIRYGEAIAALAKEYHLTLADTNAPLVAALQKAQASNPTLASKLIPDRVHPGPGGHLVMAAAVLQAWNAPSVVADIEIDAQRHRVVHQENTRVSLQNSDKPGLSFTHLDSALPWPVDRDLVSNPDMVLALTVTDYEESLNHYHIKITHLPAARYTLMIDGLKSGIVDSASLQNGIDLAGIPMFAPNVQAHELLAMTRKHNDIHFKRWRQVQVPHASNGLDVDEATQQQMDGLDFEEQLALDERASIIKPKVHRVDLIPAN